MLNRELGEALECRLTEAGEHLRQAEGLLSVAKPENMTAALAAAEAAGRVLQQLPSSCSAVLSLKAQILLVRGNALRGQGNRSGNVAAIAAFDEALRLWTMIPGQDAAYLPNHHAKTWMSRGITLLNSGAGDELREAIRCFDNAIRLREGLSSSQEPFVYYGLAAGWMNRGDALTRLGEQAGLEEALRSYEEALRVMGKLSLETNPLFRQRTAVAWLNRGCTLEAVGTESALIKAMDSFEQAIATLEQAGEVPDRRQIMAAAWMNRGNVLLKLGPERAADAREAARSAVQKISGLEQEDVLCAEIGLKARHVWCRALAGLIDQNPDAAGREALYAEATDVVDEAMEMIREWHARGMEQFGFLAGELFRFGERAYQIYQPHFVEEFRQENLMLKLKSDIDHDR